MQFQEETLSAGEHAVFFQGKVGKIQATILIPPLVQYPHLALLGHPHSLKGGTQNNKVVTTLARAFASLGIVSVRCNFRGVGESAGVFDGGEGESEDMLLVLEQLQSSAFPCILAGFSFGSYVMWKVAKAVSPTAFFAIAPPVTRFPFTSEENINNFYIFQGEEDEVVPKEAVLSYANAKEPPIPVITFEQTGHFFHGKLIALKENVIKLMKEQVLVV